MCLPAGGRMYLLGKAGGSGVKDWSKETHILPHALPDTILSARLRGKPTLALQKRPTELL